MAKMIPFPRPRLKIYLRAAILTGAAIIFILTVLQPFGTASFRHEFKYLILSGYGIVVCVSVAAFYYLSHRVINKNKIDRWSIRDETIDLFFSFLFAIMATYFYYCIIFQNSLSLPGMFAYLWRASSVAMIPVLGIYFYLYIEYKNHYRSDLVITKEKKQDAAPRHIMLSGTNKGDAIETIDDKIIFIKAEDNYVVIHLERDEGSDQRHIIRSTLKEIEGQLAPERFMRCHRSYIVNCNRITAVQGNKNRSHLKLLGAKKTIPISRSNIDIMREKYTAKSA